LKSDALLEHSAAREEETPSFHGPDLVCTTPEKKKGLKEQAERLQRLMEQAERLPDPVARTVTRQCLESILSLYGEGLARILELVREENPQATGALLDRLVNDTTIAGLLLIHGLHPLDLGTRLQRALDQVRPYMESHGGNVELISLEEGVARLRLKGTCQSCPSSTVTLELAVRSALEEACPDLAGFEVE